MLTGGDFKATVAARTLGQLRPLTHEQNGNFRHSVVVMLGAVIALCQMLVSSFDMDILPSVL